MQKFDIDRNFGQKLRSLRTDKQLTQDAVAKQLQSKGSIVTRSKYSRFETGELNISIYDFMRLKVIFGVEYNDFFEGLTYPQDDDENNNSI